MTTLKTDSKATKAPVSFGRSYIGCVIDNSSFSADECNVETINFAQGFGFEVCEFPKEDSEDYSEILSEIADEAVSFLNDQDNLPYCSWYFDDNSLFYAPSIENAREDVGFVSSRKNEYPEDDYEGEWLHVNDHGNCTLYVRTNGEDSEIWSVV